MNNAFKMLEKAIEVDDKCEFAYETLGTVEVQRGELTCLHNVFKQFLNNFQLELHSQATSNEQSSYSSRH